MHPCWLIPELAIRIIEKCAPAVVDGQPWEIYRRGLGTWCALARTCRVLQEPALNLLWHRQDTLTHLVKCLPQDCWELKTSESGHDDLAGIVSLSR